MTKQEAYEKLELPLGTDLQTVRKRFAEMHNDYRMRIDNAPTARLKEVFEKNLERIKEAYNLLNQSETIDDSGSLPRTGQSAQEFAGGSRPNASANRGYTLDEALTLFKLAKTDANSAIIGGVQEYIKNIHHYIDTAFNDAIREAYTKELKKAEEAGNVVLEWVSGRREENGFTGRQTPEPEQPVAEPEKQIPTGKRKVSPVVFGVAGAVVLFLVYFFFIRLTPEEKFEKGMKLESEDAYTDAFEYYLDAAEGGIAGAQYKVGIMYGVGLGTEVNDSLSDHWLQMGAESKEPRALYVIGSKYLNKEYIYNEEKAKEYFDKALPGLKTMAADLDSDAQLYLSNMCAAGQAMDANLEESAKWSMESGKTGNLYTQVYYMYLLSQTEDFRSMVLDDTEAAFLKKMKTDSLKNQAMSKLWKMTAQGSAIADYYLYEIYKDGYLAEVNKDSAKFYIQKAADRHFVSAYITLGSEYGEGNGLYETDGAKALNYYKMAGEQNPYTQTYVGNLYFNGTYGSADRKEAYKWYQKAASSGEPEAVYRIGDFYFNGFADIAKDKAKAYEYFEKAAKGNSAAAQYMMGKKFFYGYNDVVDYKAAHNWFKQSSDNGYSKGSFMAGYMFQEKIGVLSDTSDLSPKEYFKRAGEDVLAYLADYENDTEAQWQLYKMYANGWGVSSSSKKASDYFDKAFGNYEKEAEAGDAEAQYMLSNLYHENFGNYPKEAKALEWAKKSAEQNFIPAVYWVGMFYYLGWGMGYDDPEANKWFTKAEQKNFPEAYFYLGQMYKYGYSVSKNKIKANEYFQKAYDVGYYKAEEQMY